MTKIISGTELAKKLRGEIKEEATVLRERGIEPTLAVVLVGDNKASRSYVNSKHKACIENNINSIKIELPEEISTDDLLTEIKKDFHFRHTCVIMAKYGGKKDPFSAVTWSDNQQQYVISMRCTT